MIVWSYAWVFWLLPLPLLVRQLLTSFKDVRPAVRVPLFDVLVDSIGATPSAGAVVRRRSNWQVALYTVCWVAVLVALARPQWLGKPVVREIPTRDLLLTIDLSGSMATEDFVNADGRVVDRLAAVKEVLDDFLQRRQGDRVAMIVFGTGAFVQIPFTQDLDVCRELLNETAVRMAGPKTAFGDAIGLGITLFQRSELEDKVMIALTDGNDTGSRVPPAAAAEIAADNGIVIHTIGVGDPTAAGEELLDEKALTEVARKTGGQYFHANDRVELEGIYKELDRIGQRKVETISHRPRRDLFHWPIALVFLVSLGFFIVKLSRHAAKRTLTAAAQEAKGEEVAA